MTLIDVQNLHYSYQAKENFSLTIPHFSLHRGQNIFLEGESGSGKTTFLNLLSGLTKPHHGSIRILGRDITMLSKVKADRFRADHFGIIFQLFNLIPYLSVIENIILSCTFSYPKRNKVLSRSPSLEVEAMRLCSELDIGKNLLEKPVHQLSIGQQQRVAIARALIGQPEIIIADEPTSALDNVRKDQFMTLLIEECIRYKVTLLFVSHDRALRSHFNSHIDLNSINKINKDDGHVSH